MLKWPTIPDPTTDPASLPEPIRMMKNVLEMLTGQRPGAPVSLARVWRTEVTPGGNNSPIEIRDLQDNDLWIDTGNNNKLSFWHGRLKTWMPTS